MTSTTLTLNDYQISALSTRLPTADWDYLCLNLASECGEFLGLIAKAKRDGPVVGGGTTTGCIKELGDVLWHIACLADDLGVSLEVIAKTNLDKLASRQQRGALQGSGDNR